MLLIQNAHLIDPASRTDGIRDILIEGEKIIKIAEHIAPEDEAAPALTLLNAEGLTAIPGLVDAHVHFRDPGFTWKEDIDSGARAAAAGGVTTVVLMANTKPCVDNADTLRYVLEKGKKTPIHVATCANVTLGMKGKELVDMKALHAGERRALRTTESRFCRKKPPGRPWRLLRRRACPSASMKKIRPLLRITASTRERPAPISGSAARTGRRRSTW